MKRKPTGTEPIRSTRGYRRVVKEIARLMHARRNTPEGDRLDLLVTLVEAWEAKHYPLDLPDALAVRKAKAAMAAGDRRHRRGYLIEDMTPGQLAALGQAEVPPEYAHLDAELKDC